jgi:hypothetical protein
MSKLFNLKEWLTIPEAARHLSIVFGEDVTEADVLRLALDRRLRLSVYFVNHAKARCGKVVTWDETDWWLFPDSDDFPGGRVMKRGGQATTGVSRPCPQKLEALFNEIPETERGKYYPMMRELNIDGERFLALSDDVTTLRGVWDLPMIGNEELDIEHEYQNLIGGPAVTLQGLDGAFVEGPDEQVCQLQENFDDNEYQTGSSAHLERLKEHIAENGIDGAEAESLLNRHKEQRKEFLDKQRARPAKQNYYPAGGLPKDAVIVVRTEALRKFEQAINGPTEKPDKPLSTTERNTLLTIIAAMCKYEGIDPQVRGTAQRIREMTDDLGAHVDDGTIRTVLAKIPDALETRMK